MIKILKQFLFSGLFLAVALALFIALALASQNCCGNAERLTDQLSSVVAEKIVPANKPQNALRVATLNCNNYLTERRRVENGLVFWPKPKAERAALARLIAKQNIDIIALQEMGDKKHLRLLQNDLKKLGADYKFACVLQGRDQMRHVAFLSKNPFLSVKEFAEETTMSRGVLAVVVETQPAGTPIAIFNIHLKSRLTRTKDDLNCARERADEMKRVLEIVRGNAMMNNFILLGDFNDVPESQTLKIVEESQIFKRVPARDCAGETWTFSNRAKELKDTSDYILLSFPLAKKLCGNQIFIADESAPRASDHRLLWCDLIFENESREREKIR